MAQESLQPRKPQAPPGERSGPSNVAQPSRRPRPLSERPDNGEAAANHATGSAQAQKKNLSPRPPPRKVKDGDGDKSGENNLAIKEPEDRPQTPPEPDTPTAKGLRAAAQEVEASKAATSSKLQAAAAHIVRNSEDSSGSKDGEQSDYEEDNDDYEEEGEEEEEEEGSEKETTKEKTKKSLREATQEINNDKENVLNSNQRSGAEDRVAKGEKQQLEEEQLVEEPRDPEDPEDTRTPMSEEGVKTLLRCSFHGDMRRAEKVLQEQTTDLGVQEVSVNCIDKHGWTPLHWSASRCHARFTQFLLQHGAQVHAREYTNGWTPLHVAAIAASSDAYDVAEVLINHGASRRVFDRWGDIPHEVAPRPTKGGGKRSEELLELRKLLRPRAHPQNQQINNMNTNTSRTEDLGQSDEEN